MNRLAIFSSAALIIAGTLTLGTMSAQTSKSAPRATAVSKSFTVVETTIPEMQAALKAGRVNSREIVRQYLQRIGMYEELLHAAITVNPKALELADERDSERAAGKIR